MVTTEVIQCPGDKGDLLVVWRGMEDPPPKLPWPGEDVEVEEYTSPPPHETKAISMRGDYAACPRISVIAPRHGSEGRAGRVVVGGLTTTRTCLWDVGRRRL
jgi:hypothetical protein